jgi:hypothetical protein
MELAKSGQRDPEILCIDVLAALEATSQGGTSSVEPITSVVAQEAAE